MFYKLPKELEDKILFLSHPILSKSIQTSDLDKLLFNNSEYLQQYAIDSLKTTSIHYNCKNEYCDYSELFYSQ